MRLTKYTDYSLRVLLYLGSVHGRRVSTEEISTAHKISLHHLAKVVNQLGKLGYVDVKRGRQGGLLLAKPPEEINIGELVRGVEPDFHLVECLDATRNTCQITRVCTLIRPLHRALEAFHRVLDGYSLADLTGLKSQENLRRVLLPLARPPSSSS
jgi:Rrf2 family nitric oxide-sensitive transcriptional repressor